MTLSEFEQKKAQLLNPLKPTPDVMTVYAIVRHPVFRLVSMINHFMRNKVGANKAMAYKAAREQSDIVFKPQNDFFGTTTPLNQRKKQYRFVIGTMNELPDIQYALTGMRLNIWKNAHYKDQNYVSDFSNDPEFDDLLKSVYAPDLVLWAHVVETKLEMFEAHVASS